MSVKCFYHRERDAIGSCKACNKGLCPSCAVDVSNGLACRDQCEEQVRSVNQLIDRNVRMAPVSEQLLGGHPRGLVVVAAFAILAGILFTMLGMGLSGTARFGIAAIGLLATLLGIWQLAVAWRLRKATDRAPGSVSGRRDA